MPTAFAVRLKQVREKAGLTQEDLARTADLSTSAVAKMEQGKYEPRLSTLVAICKALKVPCAEFVPTEAG